MADPLLQSIVDNEETSLNWVVQSGRQLSMESATKPFMADAGYFRHFLDKTSNYFKTLSFKLFNPSRVSSQAAVEIASANTYDSLRHQEVRVAAGFSGPMIDFIDVVKDVVSDVEELPKTLRSVIRVLSVLLNEPDRLAAQSGIARLQGEVKLTDEKMLEDIKSFLSKQNRTVAKFSDLYENNRQFIDSIAGANELNNRLSKIDFNEIKTLVTRASELGIRLSAQLEADKDVQLSGQVAAQLSEFYYRLGVTITTTAVVLDIMGQVGAANTETVKLLESLATNK